MSINVSSSGEMTATYLLFAVSTLYVLYFSWNLWHTVKNGGEFRYKPILTIVMFIAFVICLIGVITNTPYGQIVPWFG